MPKDSPSVPPDILERVKAGSKVVAELATKLSNQIAALDGWLAGLPGNVEARCFGQTAPESRKLLVLRFSRVDKRGWCVQAGLSQAAQDGTPSYEPTFSPLADMSVEVKQAAVELFPALLQSIIIAQRERVETLTAATKAYEAFQDSVGLKGGK